VTTLYPAVSSPVHIEGIALLLIQEGMRGVVRIPTGTAHALDSSSFPIAVMGKTGTTNEFRDALFVGSTYGRGESPSPCVSALTTTIPSEHEKRAAGLRFPCSEKSRSESMEKS
jgi:hypothetical protein